MGNVAKNKKFNKNVDFMTKILYNIEEKLYLRR